MTSLQSVKRIFAKNQAGGEGVAVATLVAGHRNAEPTRPTLSGVFASIVTYAIIGSWKKNNDFRKNADAEPPVLFSSISGTSPSLTQRAFIATSQPIAVG